MASKKIRSQSLLLPGKHVVYRASVVMMVTLAMALMIMSKTNNPAVTRLRTHVMDGVTPLLTLASSPMNAVHNMGTWIGEMSRLRQENVALKNENVELLKWQSQAKAMEAENKSLHALLHVVPSQKSSFITARIVSDLGGPYVHSALINGGGDSGIKKDEAAISDNGLLGRVVDVGDSSARILLLNDINSRVPVIAENSHEKSILVGNNSDTPTLSYITSESKIKVGERIVTSGDGGIFPEGIPVGIVTNVNKGAVKVQPYVDATRVEYVSIVDYSF